MSVIRVKSSGGSATTLSNTAPARNRTSPLPIIVVLLVVGGAGYGIWHVVSAYRAKEAARREEVRKHNERVRAEREAKARAEREARERAEREAAERNRQKPPEEVVVEKPKAPEKSETEILLEDAKARAEMLAKIAEERKKPVAKALNGFGGVRFGEPLAKSGAPVKWGTVLDAGDSVAARGAAFAVKGPRLDKPLFSLGATPLVWVTPKTRKPYRIEFGRPMALKDGAKHDPETTNLVAFISQRYGCAPFVLGPNRPERKGCEYVFPIGAGTITIVERGSDLTFSLEREDLKQEALAEAETLRKEEMEVSEADDKALDSTRYPHPEIDRRKYPGVRLKDETPRAFCGIVFASAPPESAKLIIPQKGDRGFFLDYARTKCRPFRGFTRGRADVDPYRGGVFAVRLFSEGGEDGLNDREYYESVKAALSRHYKVEPKEKKGELDLPELTFTVGDLDIVFGPDVRGGFYLNAKNQVLAQMAATDPSESARPAKSRR